MTALPLLTRRTALGAIAGAIVARNAFATPDQTREWLSAAAKGTPREGKVTLKAPEIAENGNAVPVTVSVESEMTDKSFVKAIYIADGNPNPVATHASGKAEIQQRAARPDANSGQVADERWRSTRRAARSRSPSAAAAAEEKSG